MSNDAEKAVQIIAIVQLVIAAIQRLATTANELQDIYQRAQDNGGQVTDADRQHAEDLVQAARADLESAIAQRME